MRRSQLLVAGLLLCAGALATAPGSPAATAPDRAFGRPVVVDKSPSQSTGEPSLAVAPDGGVYVVAPAGPGARLPSAVGGTGSGGSLIWRSDSGGAGWSFLGSFDVPTGGGDSD